MSIRNTYPTIRPSLNLDFARSRTLDPRITFSRTTTGTYMDSDGLIKVASADEARFDHKYEDGNIVSLGLLVEEERSNLITYSEQFDNPFWTNPDSGNTITANAITAPDGTLTADLVSNVGQVVSLVQGLVTVPASSTTDYYVTIYAKKSTASYFTFNCFYSGNTEDNVNFNFDTGAVTGVPYAGEYIFQNVGNGWYRCGFRMTRDSTGSRTGIYFRFWESGRTLTSGNTYFWGAQLEAGRHATSYIPTTSASVTRSADNASITGTNFSNWYNPTEGTLFYYGSGRKGSAGVGLFGVMSDNTLANANRLFQTQIEGATQISSYYVTAGAIVAVAAVSAIEGVEYKLISAGKQDDFAFCFDGGTVTTDTSGTYPPNADTFWIGNYLSISSALT